MKERPILFSAPMVQAILDGRKTQTRRIVRIQQNYMQELRDGTFEFCWDGGFDNHVFSLKCPFGNVGDRLWVRESFAKADKGENNIAYRADEYADSFRWTPSIHMPRWASRITLEIVGVRVERLQDITDSGAESEGFKDVGAFADCWNSIYKNWHENPWVWVVEFKRLEQK